MKKIVMVLAFTGAFGILLGSVFIAKSIHKKSDNIYTVNTMPDQNGKIHTVRVFKSILSVVAIDSKVPSKKIEIPVDTLSYNPDTTEIQSGQNIMPFGENTVIHIEGETVLPEKFCIYDFDGTADSLLVLLDGKEAIEDYEYVFDLGKNTISFRNDIHPEKDAKFHIMYKTNDGAMHGFGNWGKEDGDTLAELQWKWLHKIENAPMMVMKDRSDVSNKKLSKEVGFKIELPKGTSTFISETMEGTEKQFSVMRWYDDKGFMVECKKTPFLIGDDVISAEEMEILHFENQQFTKQKIIGTQIDFEENTTNVPLVVYGWKKNETNYQITIEEEKVDAVEDFLKKL